MPVQKPFKPEEMFVPGFMAESHYFADCIRHFHLISKGVGLRKFFLYQVNRKKQLELVYAQKPGLLLRGDVSQARL